MPILLILDITSLALSIVLSTSLVLMVLGYGRKSASVFFAHFASGVGAWSLFTLLLRLSLWFHEGNPGLLLELATLGVTVSVLFLFLFAARYAKVKSIWPDAVSVALLVIVATLSYLLFTGRLVSAPRIIGNGTTHFDLSRAGLLCSFAVWIPLALALVLLWKRRRAGEMFIQLSALVFSLGLVLEFLAGLAVPIMSVTNAISVGMLGLGVARRQLFNPLRELTERLERKVAERTEDLERARSEVERIVDERTVQLLGEIGERRKAEKSLKERAERLELIARIGGKTTALLGLDELLHQAVTLIRDAFQYLSADIFLTEGDSIVLRASTLISLKPFAGRFRLRIGVEGITGWVAATGEAISVPDVTKDSRYVTLVDDVETRSELAVPLKLRGKVIGVLDVQSARVDAFTPLDMFTQQTIADQLANAIDNVQLYQQVTRRAERLALMNRVSSAVNAVLDLSDLMETVYREITPIFQADVFFIALLDGEGGQLDFRFLVEEGVRDSLGRKPLGADLASRIIKEKKPLLMSDLPGELERLGDPALRSAAKIPSSWLGVPMLIGERPVGVISVQTYEARPYDAEDCTLLSTVADQVAVAVENARLYEALKQELSERLRTEKHLRESEEQFRNLAEQLPNMIFINKGGRVVYVNQRCADVTGYTREEIYSPGFHFMDLTAPEHRQDVMQKFRMHMRGEEVSPYEYAFITREGKKIEAILTTKLIHHAGEDAILGIITDITARKRTELLLRSLNVAALAMQQALTPKEIFPAAVRELNDLGFACAVLLADASKRRLAIRYAVGFAHHDITVVDEQTDSEAVWLPIDGVPAVVAVIRERQTVLTEFEAAYIGSQPSLAIISEWLASHSVDRVRAIISPLSVGDDVFGLLVVSADSLSQNDLPIISAFAHQTAAAWRKTLLMQDLARSLEELRTTQDLLLHAQKMEAIGRLAGGIAHDFNNVLTVISGYTSLLVDSLQNNEAAQTDLAEIKNAIKRASALTSRLLAFSRRQILQPEVLDLNALLAGCANLLRPLIGEDIELVIHPASRQGRIKADPYQIEQVIINLAVNARDAMPSGGKLILETSDRDLSFEDAVALSLPHGKYVVLRVQDTGIGMSDEIKSHMFEPFFTTKEDGKGTGLGLSTVYGIVSQTGGAISVESEQNKGTLFTITIPWASEERVSAPASIHAERVPAGTGTILLVEDDEMVRDLAGRILANAGYTILEAASGESAAQIASQQQVIDLMITDIVMPGMKGMELAELLGESRPDMPVLFMSGYTDDPTIHLGVSDGLPFISKPFQPEELLKKVSELMTK